MNEQASQQHTISQVTEFLSWWKYELSLMLPEWLKNWRQGRLKRVSVQFSQGQISIQREQSQSSRTKRETYDDKSDLQAAVKKIRKAARQEVIGLRLPSDQYFKREVTLPSSARFKVNQILSMDLERSTPFQLNNIYTDYLIEKEQDSTLYISQFIVKRSRIDEPLEFMQSNGIEARFVDAEMEGGNGFYPIDFLSNRTQSTSEEKRSLSLNTMLFALLISGCLLFVYTAIDRQEKALEELDSNIQVERKKAQIISAQRNQKNKQNALLHQLYEKKFGSPFILEVWEELTRRLPNTAWVAELKINGKEVQVTGYADKAEKLLKTLDESRLFDDVAFFSPVTMDQNLKKERFRIKFNLSGSKDKGAQS